MKIICSGCGANHWLSDMQLSDGGCNVVCPRCSTKNFVDSSMIDPQSLEPRWYYAANNDSVGPLSTRDLEFTYLNGQITLETYVWCDGLSDWMELGHVPEFAYLQSPIQGTPYGSDEATRVAGGGFPSYQSPNYGDANDEETQAIDISESQRQSLANARPRGKYGAYGGSDGQDDEPVFDDMSISSTSNAANDMIGARSENSVLFSLSSLQAVSASPAPEASSMSGGGAGLIDVKALAASPAVARRRTNEVIDSFNGGAAVPMATVLPLGTKKDNTKLYIALAFAGIIMIGLIAAVIAMATSGNEDNTPKQSSKVGNVDTNLGVEGDIVAVNDQTKKDDKNDKKADDDNKKVAGDQKADDSDKKADDADKKDDSGDQKADDADKKDDGGDQKADDDKDTKKADDNKKADDKKKKADSKDKKVEPKKQPEPVKPEPKKEPAPVKPEPKKEPAPAAPAPSGGGGLTKADIQAQFRSAGAQIRTCARSSQVKGNMKISFTVKGDGRVAGTKCVSPEFANTPTAACVIKVVNGLKFRATGQDLPVNNYQVPIQ